MSEYEHKSVAATFAYQLEDLDRQYPDASRFLRVLAFLDPESIRLEMLTTGAKLISDAQARRKNQSIMSIIKDKLLRRGRATTTSQRDLLNTPPNTMPPTFTALLTLIQDPIKLRKALTHLQDRSLVAIQHHSQSSTLRIHDLVQLMVSETMKGSHAYRESFEFAVELACNAMSQIEDPWSPDWWPRCEPLVPHIQSLTREQEISTRTKRRLLLANRCCGWYLRGRGRYLEAAQLCQTMLAECERFFGAEDLDTLNVMNDLAWIFLFQGRYNDAESLLDQVLRSRNKWLGSEHRETLESMYRLAVVYSRQHRYDDGEELLSRTLRIQERQFGSEDQDTLLTMDALARVHHSQQRYGDAELIFKRVLSIRTKIFGSEHVITLSTMHELARVYDLQHRYDDAEELFTQVLLVREKTLGPGHPETLMTKYGLARVYHSQGRSIEAEPLLEYIVPRQEMILGPSHPSTQMSLALLAWVYESLDRAADAAVLRQRIAPLPQ